MNSEQRARLAVRFARAWKRKIRLDEIRQRRREKREARDAELIPGFISKRTAMFIVVALSAATVVALHFYLR
jgi:hypothetical protein